MNLLKNKKFLTIALGIFIALIMVSSVLNITSSNNQSRVKYKSYSFTKTDNGWLLFKDNTKYLLSFNPVELENVEVPNLNFNQLNFLEKIYISINPEENTRSTIAEFQRNIRLTPTLVTSCFIDVTQCSDLPLKTCNDTTSSIGVIIFKESNESEISFNNNCLTISGSIIESTKAVDKLVLKSLGVM